MRAQDCNQGYTFTASPMPVGGVYQSGQTVTFCYTVTNWSIINVNWFHGLVPTFGAGWDMSTLTPGAPPPTCGGSGGTWGWYNVCDGTAGTAIGPIGPGFFFDLDNDGDPGNNYGDLCSGAVNWQFCFSITTNSGAACVDGASLDVTVDTFGDSETGSWNSAGCHNDPLATMPATLECCSADAGNNGAVALCSTNPPVNLFTYLGGTPDPGGSWSAPGGAAMSGTLDPATATPGAYTYTVTGATCSSSAVVSVSIQQPPDAGANGNLTLCANGITTGLMPLVGGTPDPGGTWTAPGGAASNGTFTPGVSTPGNYVYTVAPTAPCLVADQSVVTVNVVNPVNAGIDASISICTTNAPTNLITLLAGAQGGGTWTAPGGAPFGGWYDPSVDAPGVFTYTLIGTAPCPNDQATVTVNESTAPNAGTDGAITVCSNGVAQNLFTVLGGTPGFGGTWTAPGGVAHNGVFVPGTDQAGVYMYSLAANPPCLPDAALVTVTVVQPPNAGTDGSLTVCSNGAPTGLFAQLGGAQAGGTWTAPGGAPHSGTFTPGADAAGIYTYTVTGTAPCGNDQATVTVTVTQPPDAGTNGVLTICADGVNTGLFAQLVGADVGGTWTAPGGAAHSGTFIPGTDVAGVYTYTVTGTAPCLNDQSIVTVTVIQPPDAGTDGLLTVCTDGANTGLFAQLGGADPGGTWTAPGGASHSGTFIPGTDAAGVYSYTVAGTAPCLNDQSIVTVTVVQPPDAGTDGVLTVCEDGAAASLSAQLGGADAGGTWTAPGGAAHSGTFTPGTDAAGVYTYTVTGTVPCGNDQSIVTVTVILPPDAGIDGLLTVCTDGANADLFAELGGPQAGGTWTAPGGAPHSGIFTPATDAAGVYTYTVIGTAPCANDQSTVTVTAIQPPYAGADGSLTVCADGAAAGLFAQLVGAQAGGTWTGPGGAAHSGAFTPGIDAAGDYTYTVAGTAPCANDQAVVSVTVVQPPDAGADGATTLCSSGATVDLFTLLGAPDPGGAWSFNAAPHGNQFDPATDVAGAYTYTVTGAVPCANDQSIVNVAVNQQPDAGVDGATVLCISSPDVDLFGQLGGSPDAGGSWSFGGAPHGNMFNPGSDAAGTYTYTVTGAAPCPNDLATVDVTVTAQPDAGSNGSITVCANANAFDLFPSLTGTPDAGGAWTLNGVPHGSIFTPGTDAPGVYTYTITVPLPCASVSATVTVNVVQPPNAGADGQLLLCLSGPAIDMFPQLAGAQAGGSWSFNAAPHSNMFSPGADVAGVYTYTVPGTAPCANDQATVTVAVTSDPDPGTNGSNTLCASGVAVDLFTSLGGTPDLGGTWTIGGAAHSSTFDPAIDAAGVYTYTVNAPLPCTSQSATVTVNVIQPPNAGSDGQLLLCLSGPPVDMFTQLTGAQAGGTWSFNAAPHSNTFTPGVDAAGVYTYTIAGTLPCPNDQATVTVAVTSDPDPGTNGSITLCASGAAVDLFASLGGTPDLGGTWSIGGAAHSSTFDPTSDVAGVYTYTVNAPLPCTSQSATVTVNVVQPPNAGADGQLLLCLSGPPVDMFAQLAGAQAGGSWSFNAAPHSNMFTPGVDAAGVYTYTMAGTLPCPNDQATVTVAVTSDPDPGTSGSITLCASDAAVDLFASLGGTPDLGGSWSINGTPHSNMFDPALDAAGVYTYTVNAPLPCTSQSATVTVNVIQPPNAGADGSALLCISSPALDLFTQLGGAQVGGSWSFNGVPHGNMFQPGVDADGTYTYTLAGTAPCAADQAVVNVTVVAEPDPGTNGAVVLCANGNAIDLFAQLGGTPDAGGAWSIGGVPHSNSFDPTLDAAGVYSYTITVPLPCSNASSTVTVLLQAPPNAGADGNITLCTTSAAADLFSSLNGAQAGGTWMFAGVPHSNSFQPGSDPAGTYTYTIAGTAPCTADQSTVTVAVNTPPNAGADGALTLCSTDQPQDLFALLGGAPQAGGAWTLNGVPHAGIYDPASDADGVFTYTVSGILPCADDAALVTITESIPVDAGGDGSITLCSSGTAVDLFTQLGGTPAAGGNWSGPSLITAGQFDPTNMLAGAYTYTVNGTAPCPNDAATVDVSITAAPDPGGDGAMLLCTGSPGMDMFTLLTGTPQAGGTWSFGGAPHGNVFDPLTDANGDYTYTVAGIAPCPDASAVVTMTVTASPDAGTPGSATLCTSDAPIALLSLLGGTPDAGGVWTAPNGTPHGAMLDPSIDAPGTYTYAINVLPPCVSTSSTVTIGLVQPADPGSDAAIALCTTSAAIDLMAQLGGSPDVGGQWTVNGSAHSGLFDPAIDPAGAYVYTLASTAPCPAVSSIIEVSVNTPPDAGSDGALSLCISSPASDLFAQLGGTPQAGGTWTFNSAVHSSLFDPAVDTPGDYLYTVPGITPCVAATATVTVAVLTVPDPGIDGAITLCENAVAIDLFTQLGGTPDVGGNWSGPSVVNGGSFDPETMLPGTYVYAIDVPLPCTSVSSEVVVSVQAMPDAGSDGASVLCITSPATDLFSLLNGTPQSGGSWIDPNGQPHIALFNPAVDQVGPYTYTVQGIAPCPAISAQVIMTVTQNPDAGVDATSTSCASGPATDLFAQLGGTPDPGGTWNGPSPITGGMFDPAAMIAGTYTYTIDVPPPCTAASSQVVVNVIDPPSSGTDGALTLCTVSAVTDLFNQLGGTPDAGGTWTVNGLAHDGSFDPAFDTPGDYLYTVTGTYPCPNTSSLVSVDVLQPPTAGTDGVLDLCSTGSAVDMNSTLSGADAGGSWTDPNGQAFSTLFDPATSTPGAYTYTVAGTTPCPADQSIITVNVILPPNAGADGAATLCVVGSTIDLFTQLGGSPDGGGSWTAPNGQPHATSFDPTQDPAGNYTYVVTGVMPCPADAAIVVMTLVQPPNAGENGSITLCPNGAPIDLFSQLGGIPDETGNWTTPGGLTTDSSFDPAIDAEGTYTYTVIATAPCTNDAAVVIVTVSDPITGTTATRDALCHGYCDGSGSVQVSGGTPGYTYAWSGNVAGAQDSAATGLCNGSYTVTITDVTGCTGTLGFTIGEPAQLVIDAIGTEDEKCEDACDGHINAVDNEGVLFSIDGGDTWQASGLFLDLCPGSYTVMMQDEDGCEASTPAVIETATPVVAAFYATQDTTSVADTHIDFMNMSGNATIFEWDFSGLATAGTYNTSYTFPNVLGGLYDVCLVAINVYGCRDSVCHPVFIYDQLIVNVPNAFTPNEDGINDGFVPIFNLPEFVEDYEFLIFNRWGEPIFSTTTIGQHWTGIMGGEAVQEDVYVWKLYYRDVVSHERHELVGHVTVLK